MSELGVVGQIGTQVVLGNWDEILKERKGTDVSSSKGLEDVVRR